MKNTVGRPKKDDKKAAISVKLPPYLIEWMDRQPESRPVLIETALCSWFQIPEHVKAPTTEKARSRLRNVKT